MSRHSVMIAVTVRVNNHCPMFLWWQFTVSCQIIVYVLNDATVQFGRFLCLMSEIQIYWNYSLRFSFFLQCYHFSFVSRIPIHLFQHQRKLELYNCSFVSHYSLHLDLLLKFLVHVNLPNHLRSENQRFQDFQCLFCFEMSTKELLPRHMFKSSFDSFSSSW